MSFLFPSSTITLEAALRDLARGSPKARAFAAHALGEITEPAEKRRALEALIAALDDIMARPLAVHDTLTAGLINHQILLK